jgi:EAL and modified HD-GYP domain-containing signal transduction protein
MSGELFGCELLFRSPHVSAVTVDLWATLAQDRATLRVIQTALAWGLPSLCGPRPVFVNTTRAVLVGAVAVPELPRQMGIEVVESVVVDAEVLAGVRRLRSAGHLIAVDDFTGTSSQIALLPYADIVKIDIRDLDRQGTGLLVLARACGALTVVERVETATDLRRCQDLGFDLVQGNYLAAAEVLHAGSYRRQALAAATVRTARSTA